MTSRALAFAARLSLAALLLSACGSAQTSASGGSNADGKEKVTMVASFYPLQFAAEQVGGAHVQVRNLTKPGAEPHDLELTPSDVASISKAKVVVYEKGLQAAVDEAVEGQARDSAVDVAPAARLDLRFSESVGQRATETQAGQPAPSGTQTHAAERGPENKPGATDPHFWLDPKRYAAVTRAIADKLIAADPAHRADYEAGAKAFDDRLTALDGELRVALSTCTIKTLVTSHTAFGYLARAYGLTQVGITGLSPEAEPAAAKLAEVAEFAKAHAVTTIYAETLVSPATADTVAKETGARVAVLDPIEGLTDRSAGKDYFEVMRSNLGTLRAGQGCS